MELASANDRHWGSAKLGHWHRRFAAKCNERVLYWLCDDYASSFTLFYNRDCDIIFPISPVTSSNIKGG